MAAAAISVVKPLQRLSSCRGPTICRQGVVAREHWGQWIQLTGSLRKPFPHLEQRKDPTQHPYKTPGREGKSEISVRSIVLLYMGLATGGIQVGKL